MKIGSALRALVIAAALFQAIMPAANAGPGGGGHNGHGHGGKGRAGKSAVVSKAQSKAPGAQGPGPQGGGPHGPGFQAQSGGRRGSSDEGQRGLILDGMADQDAALEAVRSDEALPLDRIIAGARRLTEGEIVDAKLTRRSGTLLYRLRVLEASGQVRAFYFYAQSGKVFEDH